MTLEVRQLVLKSTVSAGDDDREGSGQLHQTSGRCGDTYCAAGGSQEQLKEEILAECRAWVLAQLQQLRER